MANAKWDSADTAEKLEMLRKDIADTAAIVNDIGRRLRAIETKVTEAERAIRQRG